MLSSRSLLGDVTITHGPLDLLSQMLVYGGMAASQRGVSLRFASLWEIAEINRRNRQSWLPLFPTYDPCFWGASLEDAFGIIGQNGDGDVVATQALRVFDWPTTTLTQEAESLRFFYRDPERHRRPGESCTVTAKACDRIRGKVAFSGGIWFRPDYRGRYLTAVMVRLGRAYALGRWNIEFLTAAMSEAVFNKGLSGQVGHKNIDEWVSMKNSRLGDLRLKFMWMTMPEMLADMTEFLSTFDRR